MLSYLLPTIARALPTPSSLRVVVADDAALLGQVRRLRYRIYVTEMGLLPEDHPWVRDGELDDPYDAHSTHLLLLDGDQAVGSLRLTFSEDGPLEISEACDVAPFGGADERAVEVTRLMVSRSHRGQWATAPLFYAAWRIMVERGVRYVFGAGKHGKLGRYYRNLGLEAMDAAPFRYPTVGTGTYDLLRFDAGRVGGLRRVGVRVANWMAYRTMQLAPTVAGLKYRRGLSAA